MPRSERSQGSIRPGQRVQWWLAELDRYDNPTLRDGAHTSERGAHHALYLLQRLGLTRGARFAVARVELFDAVPDPTGANEEALDTMAPLLAAPAEREGDTHD